MFIVIDDDGDLFYDYANHRVGADATSRSSQGYGKQRRSTRYYLGGCRSRRRRRMNIQIPAQGWEPREYQLPLLKSTMTQDKRGLRAVVKTASTSRQGSYVCKYRWRSSQCSEWVRTGMCYRTPTRRAVLCGTASTGE